MSGFKKDEGKVRLELFPPEAIFAIGEILTFGANKYQCRKFTDEWSGYWEIVKPAAVEWYTAKECVGVATTNTSWKQIQNLLTINESTKNDGAQQIKSASTLGTSNIGQILRTAEDGKLLASLESMDSLRNNITTTSREAALSVVGLSTYTLITTTLQDGIEVYCAVSATTALECLEIAFQAWKKLYNISDKTTLLEEPTARNWEYGMSWGRCFGALMRHMWAWWGGGLPTSKSFLFGDLDMETGKSHLWHAGCCIVFLIAYEERSIGIDDRWKGIQTDDDSSSSK